MLTIERLTENVHHARFEITSHIYSITRDYHAAEDVYQETCVKAVGRINSFETTEHLMAWFRVTARNRAIDLIRSREGRYTGLSEETLAVIEQEWNADRRNGVDPRATSLTRCLKSLTPRSRQIVRMRYLENRSSREIALFIGGKIESAYQAIARIHKTLKTCIRQQQGSEST